MSYVNSFSSEDVATKLVMNEFLLHLYQYITTLQTCIISSVHQPSAMNSTFQEPSESGKDFYLKEL